MDQDTIKEIATQWYKKFTDPANGVYRVTHARRGNSARQFEPNPIFEDYCQTGEQEMRRHFEAIRDL